MRKYVSVWMLFVRSGLGYVLAALALEGAVMGISFWSALRWAVGNENATLLEVFNRTHPGVLMVAAFLLVSAVLLAACGEHGSRSGYRLRSLRISERAVVMVQICVNLMFYLLFWAWQVVLLYSLAKIYTLQDGVYVTGQTIMLTFYQDSCLHAVLPLAETVLYVRNFLLAVLLAVGSACYAPLLRRTSFVWEIIAFLVLAVILFPVTVGEGCGLLRSAGLIAAGILADAVMLLRLRREVEQ